MNDFVFKSSKNLLPAILQDEKTKDVLMLGFMNTEALKKTLQTGTVYFWSRTKKRLWKKGELSGNIFRARRIVKDCDSDTILISVFTDERIACHTGRKSCFYKEVMI